jgi:hypothetical protein
MKTREMLAVALFDNICRVDGVICGDRRVSTDEMCPTLSVSTGNYQRS